VRHKGISTGNLKLLTFLMWFYSCIVVNMWK